MEQQTVAFSATILDPLVKEIPEDPVKVVPEPIIEMKKECVEPPALEPPPLARQCCYIEHPQERFERHGELVDALPSIFIAFGFAYAFGILTGGLIFSSPSMTVPA